jgi:hypothetical protein
LADGPGSEAPVFYNGYFVSTLIVSSLLSDSISFSIDPLRDVTIYRKLQESKEVQSKIGLSPEDVHSSGTFTDQPTSEGSDDEGSTNGGNKVPTITTKQVGVTHLII